MTKLIQRVAAKVAIESKGSILILKPPGSDTNPKWQLPGGIRDDIAETLEETAIRECLEETGVDLRGLLFRTFMYGEWQAVDKGEKVGILAVMMHVVLPERPDVVLSHEHIESGWIDLSNQNQFNTNPEINQAVRLVL
jgi:8-oxo-dGTP pyrophosphatase MutT (NUDIX family)